MVKIECEQKHLLLINQWSGTPVGNYVYHIQVGIYNITGDWVPGPRGRHTFSNLPLPLPGSPLVRLGLLLGPRSDSKSFTAATLARKERKHATRLRVTRRGDTKYNHTCALERVTPERFTPERTRLGV